MDIPVRPQSQQMPQTRQSTVFLTRITGDDGLISYLL